MQGTLETKDRHPRVSVVVPTCGRLSLNPLLRDLERQEHPPQEILVVDNRPENTATRQLLRTRFRHCRYLPERRRGIAAARNRGWIAAREELVAFIDDDCRCGPGWLATVAASFVSRPGLGCCTGPVLPLKQETAAEVLMEKRGGFGRGGERREFGSRHGCGREILLQAWRFGSGANMAFRRSVLERIGGFDETLRTAEDLDAFFRVLRAGSDLVYEPEAAVSHRHLQELRDLRRRLFLWGWGYTSLLTKIYGSDPEFRAAARREILGWFGYQLRQRLPAVLRRGEAGFPAGLVFSEFSGGLCGLPGYFWWRRRAGRRRAADLHEMRRLTSPDRRLD